MQAESGIVPDFEVGEEFHEEPKTYYELKSQPLKSRWGRGASPRPELRSRALRAIIAALLAEGGPGPRYVKGIVGRAGPAVTRGSPAGSGGEAGAAPAPGSAGRDPPRSLPEGLVAPEVVLGWLAFGRGFLFFILVFFFGGGRIYLFICFGLLIYLFCIF